jgi:hypothetical protein
MTAHDDLDRQLSAFLREGPTDLPDPSFDAVRDRTEVTRQRVVLGPWRVPDMNKFLAVGLGVAAVLAVAVVGIGLLPRSESGVGGTRSTAPSAAPSIVPSAAPSAEPSTTVWTGLPEGPFVVTGTDDPVQVTVDIASPGWSHVPDFDFVGKNDDGLDAPESVGAALLAWAWPAGTGFNVYGDPCHWSTTIPATPATTSDEIAAALMDQAETDATTPVDVSVGGFAGKSVTLHVPMSYHQVPDVGREEEFAACDQSIYGFYGIEGGTEPDRNAQGPGQVDELWILDVNGEIVILDATYGPATPAELVEELRSMAESATFE